MHEVRRGNQPGHAGTIVEAVRAPQRRHHVAEIAGRQAAADSGAIGVVTGETGIRVDRLAANRIGRAIEFRHRPSAESWQHFAGRNPRRQKPDVSHHGLHLRTIERQRAAVHAARHARVNPVFDGDFGAEAGAVLRKQLDQPEDRQAEFLHASFKVTVAAGEIVAGKPFGWIRHLRSDMGVGRGDQVAPAPHEAAMIVIGQCADLRHCPDWRGDSLRSPRTRRGQSDGNGRNHAHRPEAEKFKRMMNHRSLDTKAGFGTYARSTPLSAV